MIRKLPGGKMGNSDLGWLKSRFHFSFADYYDPANVNFGVLRVLNDDLVQPQAGFETHPHRDMEIVSYVVEGELTHGDSMGNESTLTRGQVQYMSAGTGIRHSEHNRGSGILRFIQIWILPDREGHKPNYGEYRFNWEDRRGKWLPMVSGEHGKAPIKVHQDVDVFSLELEQGKDIDFPIGKGRQAYLVLIEGSSTINSVILEAGDALEAVAENLSIEASTTAHILIIEMKKPD